MPRVHSKTARTKRAPKAAKQPLPKEAISLTDWKCWPLVSSNETMVWPESETSFWRQSAEPQADARRSEVGGRRRERVVPSTKAPIPHAIFMCKAQGKFLDKAREAIERMQLLAAQVQQSGIPLEHPRAGAFVRLFKKIYGLPRQNPDRFRDTVRKTIELHPDRIALYSFARVPWIKPAQW